MSDRGAEVRALGGKLSYEVVIATCNRPEALALSVPLLLSQSRPPERLIVVDSSDDHAAVIAAVAQAARGSPVPVVTERGPRRGSAHQRNHGLRRVTAPVVMFPDDDSLTHPGACAAILEAFDRDRAGQVAAVNAEDATQPPPGTLEGAAYTMTAEHRAKARKARLQSALSAAFPAISPRIAVGSVVVRRAPPIAWLDEAACQVVPWMTGYRNMSFRTDLLRRVGGFDEAFGAYALFEDADASFAVARHGCILAAQRARVYHHRFPSGRGGRGAFAAMRVLNLAYVLAKHSVDLGLARGEARGVRRAMAQHHWLRRAQGLAGRGAGAREELQALRDAWPEARGLLWHTPRDQLAARYQAAAQRLGLETGRTGQAAAA